MGQGFHKTIDFGIAEIQPKIELCVKVGMMYILDILVGMYIMRTSGSGDLPMTGSRAASLSAGYTTADFRRSMTDVFEAARYRDAIINVSHHGKPWVSVVSSQTATHIQTIREVGNIEPEELMQAASSLESAISIEELVLRIAKRRTES